MAAHTPPSLPDFEDLFENAPCGYLAADARGRIAAANATFVGWTGFGRERLVDRRFQDLLAIGSRVLYETHFAPMLRLQGSLEEVALDIVRADGSLLPVLVNAVERRDDRGCFVRITVFNATERRRYERELLAERRAAQAANGALAELNATLEARVEERTRERDRAWRLSQDLLAVVGADGTLVTVNAAWTRVLGWTEAELRGTNFVAFTHPDDLAATLAVFADVFERPLTEPYEYRFRHKDGSYRRFAWTGAFEDNQVYASGRDVTAERAQRDALLASEEALRQSQKLEAVGQLTGGVAHDFNNLLTIIRSSSDLLKRPNLSAERQARYIGAISDTVDRAAKLTGQLLAFARRQALQPKIFDAREGVRSIGEMLNTLTGARIEVVFDLPDDPCCINADPSQFDTAFVNIAVNARDAMNGEGQLAIRVEAVEVMPAMRSHAAVAGAFVAISLRDTGCGMDADTLDKIFEPFFTTKEVGKGTGLGLSQVFGFAKQSGGEVAVESEVGRGTTFTLYLPRVAAVQKHVVEVEVPHDMPAGHNTRVLVVEDNAEVGGFSAHSLIDLGYLPDLVASAREALSKLAKDARRYDVVFSDVVMPGMNGVELGQEIRRLYPDLPVVLTSGYSHILAQGGTHGFELLNKPYSIEQLSRVLSKVATSRP